MPASGARTGLAGTVDGARRKGDSEDPVSRFDCGAYAVRGDRVMDETYTCSIWLVPEGQHEAFVDAFKAFARGADELGGTAEGMILRDLEDPARFVVIRRWESADAVLRWGEKSQEHPAGSALREIVPEASDAYLMAKVASLGS
jgi:heme-degrading monooxygenase HmoA